MNTRHHFFQDRQSLLMHQEAVRMMERDPSLVEKALSILRRWDQQVSPCSRPLRDEWFKIINERDWAAAIEDSERGNQLRQSSPLSILLPNDVRLGIIRLIRAEKEAESAKK